MFYTIFSMRHLFSMLYFYAIYFMQHLLIIHGPFHLTFSTMLIYNVGSILNMFCIAERRVDKLGLDKFGLF